MAKELRLLLEHLRFDNHPIIFVAHSYGGIVSRTYTKMYGSDAVLGLVLLDCPPLNYLENSEIAEFTERLPRILTVANGAADLGLLRVAGIFGYYFIQITDKMYSRLGPAASHLQQLAVDSGTIAAIASEISGYKQSLEYLAKLDAEEFDIAVICISVSEVARPPKSTASAEDHKLNWHKKQKELAEELNNCNGMSNTFMVDSGVHAELCVSHLVLEAIQAILDNKIINFKVYKNKAD